MKKNTAFIFVLGLFLLSCEPTVVEELATESPFCSTVTASPNLPAGDVLTLAQEDSAEAYDFAVEQGVELISVNEDKSYVVWWEPEGFDITQDTVVVSLHGHGDWAAKDFEVWYPELSKRDYAFLGVQWWFGRSLESEGYYEPDRIYSIIEEVLEEKGVPPGHVIFQGFSMGSARSYAVTLYDSLCGEKYFGVSIANSGQWEDDYPLYADILTGEYGNDLFEGTHWILFCGEEDYNSYGNRVGYVCDGMEHTEEVLTEFGGTVELFLRDPAGDHGSFMLNVQNRTEALDKAEELL